MPFNLHVPASTSEASVTIQSDTLRSFLKLATPVVPSKSSVAILNNVRIVSDNGSGYLLANDLGCSARVDFHGAGKGKIDLAVKFSAVSALVAKMEAGSFLVERKEDMLSFKSTGNLQFELKGILGTDFPDPKPLGKKLHGLTWTYGEMEFVHSNLSPICTADKEMPALAGIMASTDGTDYGFLATDRHLLVCTGKVYGTRYVLPRILFETLSSVKFVNPMEATFHENGVSVTCGNVTVTCVYIKGSFPETIGNLIPTEFKYRYKLRVGKLRDHVNKMVELATSPVESTVPLAIYFRPDTFFVDMMDAGCSDADTCGEDLWMRMDARKWQVALARFNESSEITAGFNDNTSSTVWQDSKATTLIMPLTPKR